MKKTLIIAEAGVNHNGDINLAHKLIDEACQAGADIIKFQSFNPSLVTTSNAKKANYQIEKKSLNESQQEMLSKLKLSEKDHFELVKHCNQKKIEFLSTAFDQESIDLLSKLNLKRIKVPSGEVTNLPYLRNLILLKKPLIISTGMCDLNDIKLTLEEIYKLGLKKNDITLLHCSTEYPVPIKNINLNAMITLKNKFKIDIGYSDHSLGIEVPIAAAALGAKVIEKHLTLDKNFPGPDHRASIEIKEFKKMVESIRNIDIALGSGEKYPSQMELTNRKLVRKSIVATKTIKKGEIFTSSNLSTKRPGSGISPMEWDQIIGRKSEYDFQKDDLIKW